LYRDGNGTGVTLTSKQLSFVDRSMLHELTGILKGYALPSRLVSVCWRGSMFDELTGTLKQDTSRQAANTECFSRKL
jgi:hypothetical protein